MIIVKRAFACDFYLGGSIHEGPSAGIISHRVMLGMKRY